MKNYLLLVDLMEMKKMMKPRPAWKHMFYKLRNGMLVNRMLPRWLWLHLDLTNITVPAGIVNPELVGHTGYNRNTGISIGFNIQIITEILVFQ